MTEPCMGEYIIRQTQALPSHLNTRGRYADTLRPSVMKVCLLSDRLYLAMHLRMCSSQQASGLAGESEVKNSEGSRLYAHR